MVPRRGLEPPRLAAHGPEPCASTNSATWAGVVRRSCSGRRRGCQRAAGRACGAAIRPPRRVARAAARGYSPGDPSGGGGHVETRHDLRRLGLRRALHRPAHGEGGLAGARGRPPPERGEFRAALRRRGAGGAGLLQHPRRRQRPRRDAGRRCGGELRGHLRQGRQEQLRRRAERRRRADRADRGRGGRGADGPRLGHRGGCGGRQPLRPVEGGGGGRSAGGTCRTP